MATLVLSTVGQVVGTFLGGPIGGLIGRTVGAVIGSSIDNFLFAPSIKSTQEGPRLQESQILSSTEGQPIIRGYGRFRTPGNLIWATRFREEVVKETTTQGGKGGQAKQTSETTTYNYFVNFAVGLCEGEIQSVHRVWADGKLFDLSGVTYRVYRGTEAQTPDSLITTKEGTGNVPAYRGLAYIVFEDMQINNFGNRIPQMSFEITRPVKRSDNNSVGDLVTGIDLIPGSTEFGYDPNVIQQTIQGGPGGSDVIERRVENNHDIANVSDWKLAIDQLQQNLPNCNIVTLVVTWFGDDLRMAECTIKPKVENRTKTTEPISWIVAGQTRATADLISTVDGRPAFGGSPNDLSVYRAILDLKTRGFEVMLYPFIIMDIPVGNTLPNPYQPESTFLEWWIAMTFQIELSFRSTERLQDLTPGTPGFFTVRHPETGYVFTSANYTDTRIDGFKDHNGTDPNTNNNESMEFRSIRISNHLAEYPAGETNFRQNVAVGQHLNVEVGGKFYLFQITQVETANQIDQGRQAIFQIDALYEGIASTGTATSTTLSGQAVYPWRGRITCDPAIGQPGTVDKTAAAATQAAAFLGNANSSDFSGSGGTVNFAGTATDWGFRRFILHMAELCRQAGGVEYFCLGTEMVQATFVRSSQDTFPFVDGLVSLAAQVNNLLPSAQIGYAADWSEFHSHRPTDGTGDVYFHLDTLWSNSNIDFIGIDNYLPLSDWRDGTTHADYGDGNDSFGNPRGESIYDIDYLKGQIEGGEYYDYFYASDAARNSQTRSAISDGQHSQPWIFRNKDIKNWWLEPHYNRNAGLRDSLLDIGGTPRSWGVLSGATLVDDPSAALFKFGPPTRITSGGSAGARARASTNEIDNTGGKRFVYRVWCGQGTSNKVRILIRHSAENVNVRYNFTTQSLTHDIDTAQTLNSLTIAEVSSGIFLISTDITLTSADTTVTFEVGPDSSVSGQYVIAYGAEVHEFGVSTTGWVPQSKKILFTEFGSPAINKGTNQPNVFFDPKSSESNVPHFSSGSRDDEIQRQYIRATMEYWNDNNNNPASTQYSGRMIDTARMSYWSYDARPWPTFPVDGDAWADQANWEFGHWISGRIDTVYIPDLLRELAEDYGITATFDFSRAYGSCDGFVIQANTSFRSTVEPLATIFMFDIIESGDRFKAVSEQEVRSLVTLDLDGIAEAASDEDEPVMLTRRQETELPAAFSIRYIDIFKEYEVASVDQRRETVEASGSPVTDTPIVLDMSRAQQMVDRLLYIAWSKRTSAEFGVLPEFIYLETGDVVTVNIQGITRSLRLESVTDTEVRRISARTFGQTLFETGGSTGRTQPINLQPVASAVLLSIMDLPLLRSSDIGYRPYVAGFINPWPQVNVFKSITTSNFSLDSTLFQPSVLGQTTATFNPGVTDVWDDANELRVEIYSDTLSTIDELSVLNNANSIAVENSSGNWEIVQFVNATLTGTRQYTLTRLLRGQLGTEDNMQTNLPSGSRIVLLNTTLQQLELGFDDINRQYNYRYGPADKDIGDPTYLTIQKTVTGRGLKPFSPVHIRGTASGSDMVISWIRRTRVSGDNWEYLDDVPLGEAFEKYEVDIFAVGSSTVVRTLTVTDATQVTYTGAQRASDNLTGSFDVNVYQLSDTVGRGTGRRATING